MEKLASVLFIYVVGTIHAAETQLGTCPYQLVENCACNFTMTCSGLQTFPELITGDNVTTLQGIMIFAGNLSRITDNSLSPGLSILDISDNPISEISENALKDSAETLKLLSFKNTALSGLPNAIKLLRVLTGLTISDTNITDWNTTTLYHVTTTLRQLKLKKVGLSQWPSWLSFFTVLTTLDVSENILQYVPDNAFLLSKYTLMELRLNACDLTDIPQALNDLKKLSTLDLSNNNIADIDGRPGVEHLNLFSFATTLEELLLNSINLTIMPKFSNMTNLKILNLSNNQISFFSKGLLPSSLTNLDLSKNQLTSVPVDIANMSHLEHLDLSDNGITSITFRMFHTSLRSLYLSSNKIENIADTITPAGSQLSSLLIDGNPLTRILSEAFRNSGSLTLLDIKNTKLTQIPASLVYLTNITAINFLNIPSLNCSASSSFEIANWFQSRSDIVRFHGSCNNGEPVSLYFWHYLQSESSST